MTLHIFYSWQSDGVEKHNRYFIKDVLERAAKTVEQETGIAIVVDHSTQGVMGAPPIAETILEKIRSADVFAVDTTLVGQTFDGSKKLLNSNVAIELGYASYLPGYDSFLQIMNTAYGELSDLPFDMRHRRAPLTYCLVETATKEEIGAERNRLAIQIAPILIEYVRRKEAQPARASFDRVSKTSNAAVYWEFLEPLVPGERWHDPVDLGYDHDEPLAYLRISPTTNITQLSMTTVSSTYAELISCSRHSNIGENRFGTIRCQVNEGSLVSSAQLFENGEIWAIDKTCFRSLSAENPIVFTPVEFQIGFLIGLIENVSNVLPSLGYPSSYQIECGIVGIEQASFFIGSDGQWSPIKKINGNVSISRAINMPVDLIDFFHALRIEVYRSAREDAPAKLPQEVQTKIEELKARLGIPS